MIQLTGQNKQETYITIHHEDCTVRFSHSAVRRGIRFLPTRIESAFVSQDFNSSAIRRTSYDLTAHRKPQPEFAI